MDLDEGDRRLLSDAAWMSPLGPYSCFGRSWTVETNDADLAELVADLYSDLERENDIESVRQSGVSAARFRVIVGRDGSPGIVARDDRRIGHGTKPAAAMGSLVWGINRWVLDEASSTHLLLHAGGVVDSHGRAVVLPAPSESGKSTLTMGLLERGLAYLSDEAVALGPRGTVRGYPKPVSIDGGSFEVLAAHRPIGGAAHAALLERQWHVRASAVSSVAREAELCAIVFPRYDPEASSTVLEPLDPSAKLLRASHSTFAPDNKRRVGRRQVAALANRLTGVPAFDLVSSDLNSACDAVFEVLRDLS